MIKQEPSVKDEPVLDQQPVETQEKLLVENELKTEPQVKQEMFEMVLEEGETDSSSRENTKVEKQEHIEDTETENNEVGAVLALSNLLKKEKENHRIITRKFEQEKEQLKKKNAEQLQGIQTISEKAETLQKENFEQSERLESSREQLRQALAEFEEKSEMLSRVLLELDGQNQLVSLLQAEFRDQEEELGRRAARYEAAQEERNCVICLATPSNVVFSPCGHLSCCQACADIDQCPICRADIQNKMRVFFS